MKPPTGLQARVRLNTVATPSLAGALDELLDVDLGHPLADLSVDGVAAAAVQEAAQVAVVEG
jgi:hypothetical protein